MRSFEKPKGSNTEREPRSHVVVFSPNKKKTAGEERKTLLEAAGLAGVRINNLCGGRGSLVSVGSTMASS